MKKLHFLFLLFIGGQAGFCQTKFTTPLKSTTKQAAILIERNNLIIQGYDGDEIKIEIEKPISLPAPAEGLKRLKIKALEDNTELGLNVSQEDTLLVIREVCNCYSGIYRLLLPNKMSVSILENYAQGGQRWEVSNFKGNFEAQTEFGSIYLKNMTGKIKAHSRHGSVNANLDNAISVSLSALYGKVYLEMPENTKANLSIKKSEWIDVFTDFKLNTLEETQRLMTANLNGGGMPIELKSEHGNIFLRKK